MTLFAGPRRPKAAADNPMLLPGLTCWLRDEYIASSGDVSQWTDKSGNGRHATATGSAKPIVSTSAGINNHELYTFGSSNNTMSLVAKSNLITASAFTIYALVYAGAATANNSSIDSSNCIFTDTGNPNWGIIRGPSTAKMSWNNNAITSHEATLPNDTWAKMVFAYDGTKTYSRSSSSSDAGYVDVANLWTTNETMTIGGSPGHGPPIYYHGAIAEVAIYNQFHSLTLQNRMFAYQLGYFGV